MATLGEIRHARAVTPNDTQGIGSPTTYLSLGAAGTVTVDMYGGEVGIVITLPAGLYPLCVTKVYSTGTTATGIVAHWS